MSLAFSLELEFGWSLVTKHEWVGTIKHGSAKPRDLEESNMLIFCWLAVFYLFCHLCVCCLMKTGNDKMKGIVPSPVCTDRKSSECLELNLDLPQLVDPTPLALLSPPLLYQGSHSFYDSFPQADTAHESYCLLSYFYFYCCDPWQQWGGKGYSAYSSRLQCITAGKSQERKAQGSCSQHGRSHQQRDMNSLLIPARLN